MTKEQTYLPYQKYYLSGISGLIYIGVGNILTHILTLDGAISEVSTNWDLRCDWEKQNFKRIPRAVGWHIQYQSAGYNPWLKPFPPEN